MDLSKVNTNNRLDNLSFQGQRTVKHESGKRYVRLTPPPSVKIDNKNEELGIELIMLAEVDKKGAKYNWRSVGEPIRVNVDHEFKNGTKTYFDVNLQDYWLDDAGEYGYRYVVYKKDKSPLEDKEVLRTYTDSIGTPFNAKDNGRFTVASTRQGTPDTSGAMYHAFLDSYNALSNITNNSKDSEKSIEEFRRTHFNKAGGTINGVTEKLDSDLSEYKYIMLNPTAGGGEVSSHLYHPKNNFRVPEGIGSKEDLLNLQVECFKRGKGYVLDGAFTSQGYEGLQFNHAMKWGEDSPFKYWFKNPSDDAYKLAVLSDSDNSHTGIRIVNPYKAKGYDYDPNMPSYIQFYDDRLTDKSQLEDKGHLITKYAKSNTDDPYEITTRQDSVLPNFFEIDPKKPPYVGLSYGLLKDMKDKDDILSPKGRSYILTRTGNAGGYTGWDGNIDMVKMNLSNHSNSPKLIEGCTQARNQMFNAARYWSEETRNAIIMDVADELNKRCDNDTETTEDITPSSKSYLNEIEKKYKLDRNTLVNIYKRILAQTNASDEDMSDYANYNIGSDNKSPKDFIQEKVLNFPLESLDYSPELLAVLSTPYITPRPSSKIGASASKKEIMQDAINNTVTKLSPSMEKAYREQIPSIISMILRNIQDKNNLHLFDANSDSISNITPLGKYFIEMATDDIMNYIMTESLFSGDTYADYKNSKLEYGLYGKKTENESTGRYLTLKRLLPEGARNAEEEANKVAKMASDGMQKIINKGKDEETFNEFCKFLSDKYLKYNLAQYKMAEAVVDQTGAGLNWRFDAAKDVGDWDEARQGTLSSEAVWDDVISFWTPFVSELRKVNPSSYVVAEVTSLGEFNNFNWGKYDNQDKAENAFYQKTGATTGSNYSTFFGLYPKLFGKNVEEGNIDNYRSIYNFMYRAQDFIQPGDYKGHCPSEFILGSHVFLDNHDKPRAAHLMAVDAKLFWSDFQDWNHKLDKDHISRAEKVLDRPYNDNMSSKAVAVAEKYLEYFDKAASEVGLSQDKKEIIKKAIKHLANGYKYKAATSNPNDASYKRADAFGSTPFEITAPHVMEQACAMGLKIENLTSRKILDSVLEKMRAPYISKMIAINELATGTVGIMTTFAGDEFAQTGSETKSKNFEVGCRNVVRHDWINENPKKDVIDFYNRLDQTKAFAKSKGASALSNGSPVIIFPDVVSLATKDEIINGLKQVGEDNLKDVCRFTGKNSQDEIIAELQKMEEGDIKQKVKENIRRIASKDKNTGRTRWVLSKIVPDKAETGAILKYNDKGENVITMVTNAFIPKDPQKVSGLVDNADAPFISDIELKDEEGNLIARTGTVFEKMTYDKKKNKYVPDGVFLYNKNGTLISAKGENSKLDSTVTYFVKKSH